MELKTYPIHKLDGNITAILQTIISADIPGCINKGLSNEIHFIDEGTSITDSAKIVPDILMVVIMYNYQPHIANICG